MGFHHVAVVAGDMPATHRFYTEAMGFELVKVVAAPTEGGGGWARHVFYGTGGGGLIAFWELHDPAIPQVDPALSTGLGLPVWVNHLAFDAPSLDALEEHKQRWLGCGHSVLEVDHGWCTSIYTRDPNGTLVEWCTTTAAFTDQDRATARRLLAADRPELEELPRPRLFKAPVPEPA